MTRTATNDPGHCPARAARMLAVFDRLDNCMRSLADRWADERDYEDIADYRLVIEKAISSMDEADGMRITRMIKRPFGFECDFLGAKYRVTSGSRRYGYSRIG
jgi:hypothetical protein